MKLATLKTGHPDGELVVVSRDLKKMTSAADIALSLRVAFDDWGRNKKLLQERYAPGKLEPGRGEALREP